VSNARRRASLRRTLAANPEVRFVELEVEADVVISDVEPRLESRSALSRNAGLMVSSASMHSTQSLDACLTAKFFCLP
jgi:hypothetical protein